MSFMRRAMVYLGLVDDDYEPYDDAYDELEPAGAPQRSRAAAPPPMGMEDSGAIRTLPREPMAQPDYGGAVTVTPRPAVVRPITPVQSAKVHVVEPSDFRDAQEIGDRFKAGQPVIVTMQGVDPELRRRLIDFCSGVTYVLDGKMQQVTRGVFLLTPTNVEVSAEEKRRLQERGLYR